MGILSGVNSALSTVAEAAKNNPTGAANYEKDGRFYLSNGNEISREQYIINGGRPSDISQQEVQWSRDYTKWQDGISSLTRLEKQYGLAPGTLTNKADVAPTYVGSPAAAEAPVSTPTNPNPSTRDILDRAQGLISSPSRTNAFSAPFPSAPQVAAQSVAPNAKLSGTQSTYTGSIEDPQSVSARLNQRTGSPSGTRGQNPSQPPNTVPQANRSAIDPVLQDVNSINSFIFGLAGKQNNYSVAEAQLRNAADAARRAALGQARGGNRRDRAMLERQALAEGVAIEQGVDRDAALLRAQEEDQNRRFQMETASKAAELGLNVAAVLTDLSTADLQAATQYVNNQFQQLGLDKQLSQEQTQTILNFTRDMAAIQFEYDQLSVVDQNEADQLLMQKYGIDQGTYLALKQLKQAGRFDWGGFLTTLVAGGIQGGTMALGAKLF